MRSFRFFISALFIVMPLVASAEFSTIDDLVKAYSDEACQGCHQGIHKEWKESYHSQAVVHSMGGMRNFAAIGIKKEWNRPLNKPDLMKCFHCHAPQLYEASEGLVVKVGEMIIAAVDEQDPAKKEAAKKELAKLNVNCVVCHNLVVTRPSSGWFGKPEKGTMYGPKGAAAPHKTAKSGIIVSTLFCGQCHGIYNPPDNDVIFCNTLYDSYLNAYIPGGGQKTCQECHMKEKNRGHRFPGAYEADIVKEGLEFEADATGYKHLVGKEWEPRIVVTANIFNRSGHRTPDG